MLWSLSAAPQNASRLGRRTPRHTRVREVLGGDNYQLLLHCSSHPRFCDTKSAMSAEDRYGDVEKRQLEATILRMQAPRSFAIVLRLYSVGSVLTDFAKRKRIYKMQPSSCQPGAVTGLRTQAIHNESSPPWDSQFTTHANNLCFLV
ncbi:hypothetical protein HBH56_083010 [Parastagonospora nodorum]|nr:hypothetical protein HBH56_083010 [Parastagonospora nodorum]KAH3955846.1 hypothetical protein HBH53_005740 [Parastagonospora nodorum]KAH4271425.1 hypothetical protein HBI03_036970 [Parastagonospora nodorum]KAH4282456.1 hypothetical protein HBI04_031830 [Parastagonospora nodorum]KAH4318081.1 hypothetical protein HBI02_024030 [Parastagonospora nodorum]